MAKDRIRKVPKNTPMFEQDMVDGKLSRQLTRTWIKFFEDMPQADGGTGSSSGDFVECVANLAVAFPAEVKDDVIPHKIIRRPFAPDASAMNIKFPNTGASFILDVRLVPFAGGAIASIYADGAQLIQPVGGTGYNVIEQNHLRPGLKFLLNDLLLYDIKQVGSDYPGKVIAVSISGTPL